MSGKLILFLKQAWPCRATASIVLAECWELASADPSSFPQTFIKYSLHQIQNSESLDLHQLMKKRPQKGLTQSRIFTDMSLILNAH